MALPIFRQMYWKYPVGSLMFATSYTLYYLTNHFPVFEPKTLPMTFVDLLVPLVPLTVFIYISEYFFFAFVYIALKKIETINRYLYSYFSLQVFSCFIFLIFPTTFPRETYPLPEDISPFLRSVWTWLHQQDAPTNCFPSLHVSSVLLSAFVFIDDEQPKLFRFCLIWGILIMLSTLTTKQHYLADLVSGTILALFFYWMFFKKVEFANSNGQVLSQGQ